MKPYEDMPRVVQILDQFEIVLNRGTEHEVNVGDRYLVFGLGSEIFDPDTNESLGVLEEVRGRVEVKHVQEKMATARSIISVQASTGRRIYRKPNSKLTALAALTYGMREEEIVEEATTTLAELPAKVGDYLKPI